MRARLLCALLLLVALPASAGEKLGIMVSPRVAMAPATVRVKLRIPRHPDNRMLHVAVDGERFYRSSTIQIDGENAPGTVDLAYGSLPSGEYVVSALLLGTSQQPRAVASMPMLVH